VRARAIHRIVAVVAVLGTSAAIGGQARDTRVRLTPAEVDAVRTEVAGAGTSGLPAVTTRVLFGEPTRPGLYTIELRIAPNTTIQAHTHRDTRTAIVVDGVWYFGYGARHEQTAEKALARGSFYTEPSGQLHFARTGSEGATVEITGYGPTDTMYAK
jgi:quercetin dioxygenase-like cupin family protein